METKEQTTTITPPRLISSILTGFNTVANHIGLILFPVILDLIIWMGPHLRLKELLSPLVANMIRMLETYNSPEVTELISGAQQAWEILLDRLNLTGSLSTFPIGIPSMVAGSGINQTPLGLPLMIEVNSLGLALLIFFGLVVIGISLGSVYFGEIARRTAPQKPSTSINIIAGNMIKGLGLTFLLLIILLIMSIPALFMVSLVALFSPFLSQILLFGISFVFLWILVPLVFSPHGIFANQLSISRSVITSIRVVRAFLPGTGMFLLVSILLAQVLDRLWQAPPGNSWLMLIGITGHAFIYTSLLAASFIYYRQGLEWTQHNIDQFSKSVKI